MAAMEITLTAKRRRFVPQPRTVYVRVSGRIYRVTALRGYLVAVSDDLRGQRVPNYYRPPYRVWWRGGWHLAALRVFIRDYLE